MKCEHEDHEREDAVLADGMCPMCLQDERDALAANLAEAQVAFVARGMDLRDVEARLAEADKANQLLRVELAAAAREEDLILIALRLDPERYRTECGFLNVPKIIAAIKNPSMYPRTTPETVSGEGER